MVFPQKMFPLKLLTRLEIFSSGNLTIIQGKRPHHITFDVPKLQMQIVSGLEIINSKYRVSMNA